MRGLNLFVVSFLASVLTAAGQNRIVCYFGSWANWRPGNGRFVTSDIDTSLCTHVIWSFATLQGNQIVAPNADGVNGLREFTQLRRRNPGIRLLIAIGGATDSQGPKYSRMVSSPGSRGQFINSVIALLRRYRFDGFDLDWEYPTLNGGAPSDRHNFVLLLREMKERFNREGGFLLTAAVGAGAWTASQAYDIRAISQHLDFINLMTYDFRGSWERRAGHHAALRGDLSVESSVRYWLDRGCPREKLVVGVPTYGRTWTLANPNNNAPGAPASSAGQPGPYMREAGSLGYNELCEQIRRGQWNLRFDGGARAPYAFRGNQWVSYDSVGSVTEKAHFIRQQRLGGAMIWSIETDDKNGACGPRFPILRALNAVLRR
ncbi:acidic mammalian chitinase-like [Fopius arisanus]|uniref:Acidic mammalian chitinase-like n=1 Tax=Fopius arisanus TaxID=64838 RepID=A0A9R1TCQ1_9HYME|nr:PREDICTED: acidic mammalian chitinase-like [Fopius arisanus]